jgi:hypothetical protein
LIVSEPEQIQSTPRPAAAGRTPHRFAVPTVREIAPVPADARSPARVATGLSARDRVVLSLLLHGDDRERH